MKQPNFLFTLSRSRARALALASLWTAFAAPSLFAAESAEIMVKPPVPLPGGLSPHPVITSVGKTNDVVSVEWFGIQGPFEVLHSTTTDSNSWKLVGLPTYRSRLNVSLPGEDAGFFRVLSGRPTSTDPNGGTMNYVGASVCADCHEDAHMNWEQTGHAKALDTLKAIKQDKNSSCLPCHTVGYGTPLGFKDEAATPHLAGVQCENCHGPAGAHLANVRDASVRPKVTVAAEVCGGCHTDFHHPTFDEWKTSPHAKVTEDVASSMLQQGEPRMLSCGPCHSGAVRESLLEGLEKPGTPLPNRIDAAYFGVTCAVCHDAHVNMPNPPKLPNPQLRNPLYSTDNFSYNTGTNTTFAAQYNPDIQVCAQCHNMRGARWQDTSRPPHHSPQYNVLIGKGAFDLGNGSMAAHGFIENQCAQCHTHPHAADSPSAETPSYTGHAFEVRVENCTICHLTTEAAEHALEHTQTDTKSKIEAVRALLDNWATNKAPADLQAKYGRYSWEYTTAGQISNPTNNPAIKGPSSADQAKVPDAIKQARMNMYLVEHDGSYGVHNGTYARYLLQVATTNVNAELSKP
jgi:hypothetical protein